MSDLYDTDILTWSEEQAALLRRVADGANAPTPDWPNIIEEIESVGRSEVDAVESWLIQALLHMLKSEAWPLSQTTPRWQADARMFRRQARRKFRESMRQKIDVAELYATALTGLPDTMDGQHALPVPTVCPVTLDEMLSEP